jgi:competence protein ComEC
MAVGEVVPEPQAGLGFGLLLGVKQALGSDIEAAFRKTGIIHIVVLSGYNVMLIVAFTSFILSFVLPLRPRVVIGLIAIVAFALMVGLSATVVRASIMAALLLISQLLGRTYVVLRALVLALAIMVGINPFLLVYDVGFQLSFLATLGLIFIAPHFEQGAKMHSFRESLRGYMLATIATQLAVLPLLLWQIGEFSLVAVVVNVLVLPMVAIAMALTFITGAIALVVPSIAFAPGVLAYWSLQYILVIATTFSNLPFASFVVPPFPFWIVPLAYALIGYILWRVKTRPNRISASINVAHSTKLELSDWHVIDETSLLVKRGEGSLPSPRSPSLDDTPIFFR